MGNSVGVEGGCTETAVQEATTRTRYRTRTRHELQTSAKFTAAAQQQLTAVSLLPAAAPRRIAHVHDATAGGGGGDGGGGAAAVVLGWVGLCQAQVVAPAKASKGWRGLCQMLGCAMEIIYPAENNSNNAIQ